MPMQRLIATKALTYNTRRLKAGDEFEARPQDVRLLVGIRKARLAQPEQSPEPPQVEPPPQPQQEARDPEDDEREAQQSKRPRAEAERPRTARRD